MKVTLQYFGQLGHFAGKDQETLVPSSDDIVEMLRTLCARYGAGFQQIVLDAQGAPRPSLMLLVNGTPVPKTELPRLKDGDTVTLMPAISGG